MNSVKKFTILLLSLATLQSTVACRTPKNQKAYMKKTYKRLKRNLKDAQVSKLQDTVKVLFPSNLMFAPSNAEINATILPKMNRFAKALNRFSRTAVLINGHTDNTGEEDFNNQLSENRAISAKKALVNYSVADNRINTWGLGQRHPIASNDTEEGKALNRRVEFIVLYKK